MAPPLDSRATYTLADINALLQKECAHGFSAIPSIDNFTFTRTPQELHDGDIGDERPDRICGTRLRIGQSSGEYTTHSAVFLCLVGEGKNSVMLNCDSALYKFSLDNLSYVDLDSSFRQLLRSETELEVLTQAERNRLKAFGCYLFLSAGHIQTIQSYPRFEDNLRYACTRFTSESGGSERMYQQQDLTRKNEATSKRMITVLKYPKGSRATSAAATVTGSDSTAPQQQDGRTLRHMMLIPDDSDEDTPLPVPEVKSVDDNLKKLIDCLETAHYRLLTFESAYKVAKHEADSVGEMKRTIEQQANELTELKQQLQERDAKIEMMGLETAKLQQATEKEKAACEVAARLRDKAETRLNEYLEAQKQMAEKYHAIDE